MLSVFPEIQASQPAKTQSYGAVEMRVGGESSGEAASAQVFVKVEAADAPLNENQPEQAPFDVGVQVSVDRLSFFCQRKAHFDLAHKIERLGGVQSSKTPPSEWWIRSNPKRIVVMTGAGVSTGAGIPDFRSPVGLSLMGWAAWLQRTSGENI
ncbi:hypothetical protein M427DRAFT_46146 [Gonapodya prolifera JEL478]|uniref:Uncharacterized protein n=1 Tax=Gonapodya prolifera (strain JEL478) TaxID=1344416 RepID=A0A139A789_GONPJ|nr:hypothetical protein M427DRAFT_46146 [Gonapodya prolifera JEL478]|eukprot:KXS12686.1 hypothetical protein M427DRAFT_46146 [Gonapodya prolifera JEL478]